MTFIKRSCICLIALMFATGNLNGQVSFSVAPTKIYFEVEEGGTRQQTITVRNNGQEVKSYTVSFLSWERNEEGEKIFAPDTGQVFSIARMLNADPAAFNLEPGGKRIVTVSLAHSDHWKQSSLWAMLLVKELNTSQPLGALSGVRTAINVEYQIGVHVYQQMPGSSGQYPEMALDSMYYSESTGGKKVNITFQNSSGYIAEGQLKVQLFAMDKGKRIDLPLRSLTFLPNRKRTISVMLPDDLKPGDYTISASFDLGYNSDLLVGDMYFKVSAN